MSLDVFWTDEATETFDAIILFIEHRWSEEQAAVFVKHTQKVLMLIAEYPYMYKESLDVNVRQAVITAQTSLYYEVREKSIALLFFWDNRQDSIL